MGSVNQVCLNCKWWVPDYIGEYQIFVCARYDDFRGKRDSQEKLLCWESKKE